MISTPDRSYRALTLAGLLLVAGGTGAQGAGPQGDAREAMWFAPTAEDWAKPCLIPWQRTWEDAVAVSKDTGKPILVCVNMDGEIASEHYAGIRYRMPEIAAIYEPYVTVMASVYRHSPRDYDQRGQRVLCPRFGSVTCGEHIALEPIVYDKFLDERRIAPRHIMVDLEGAESFDIYYAFDTDSVFQTIVEGVKEWPATEDPTDVASLPLEKRVASPELSQREAVERAYVSGDRSTRRRIVEAAKASGGKAPIDVLRLAVFDLDVELNRLALEALAQSTSESAIDLINESLRVPLDAAMRAKLVAALERLGETYPRARTLAAVHKGLQDRSDAVDVASWSTALEGVDVTNLLADRLALEYQMEAKDRGAQSAPRDGAALVEFAEASLALAVDASTQPEFAALLYEDARLAALEAEELGTEDWRIDTILALASYYAGDLDEAGRRAEQAVTVLPSGEESWNAMAVLALFAQARQRAIFGKLRDKEEWPREWLTDVNDTYSVLAAHPFGREHHVVAHHDFLRRLGAFSNAQRVLADGLERYPHSWDLHARLRGRVLWEKGADGLEEVYARMLDKEREALAAGGEGDLSNLEWYAGYASLVVAEYKRREAEPDEAIAAYERAIAHYDRAIAANPESGASSDHYVALALAGQARIAFERERYDVALEEILASFERRSEAAASLDGLEFSPVMTAQALQGRLRKLGHADEAARVQAALDGLDPELLRPPVFERNSMGAPPVGFREGLGGRRRADGTTAR